MQKIIKNLKIAFAHPGRTSFAVVSVCAYAIASITLLLSTATPTAEAAIPKVINFQGKLTKTSDGTNVSNGTYAFQFKLYNDPTSGSLLWTETFDQPSGSCGELTVTNGVFNAKLGSCASLAAVDFSGGALYLTVNFDPGSGYDGEMSPRKQLLSSAFAFVANSVNGDGTINIANTGNDQATIGYDTSNKLVVDVNNDGFTTFTSSGTGAGYNIAGGNVGIGTSSLSAKLHVTSTTEQLRLSYDGSNHSSFTTSSGGDLTIAPSGSDLAVTGNVDISGTLTAGSSDAFTVNSSGTVTIAAGQSYTGAGAVTLSSGTATQLTIDSGTTGTIALGTDASAETINIGTGSAAKTVNVGSTNTTSATVVQSGSGSIQLQANGTSTGTVYVGTVGTTTTPDLIVLGSKSDAGDPTGINGAMYYNSSGKFMVYEAGAWKELCNKTDAACGAGSGSAWSALSAPAANLSLNMAEYTSTFTWNTEDTAAAFDSFSLAVTNDASTDANIQRLLVLSNTNAAGSTATERLLVLNNADTDELVTTAVEVASAAGGITTAIDVSDSDIGTALNVGANDIVGTTGLINYTNFDVDAAGSLTAVGVNSGSGLLQGTGGLTLTGTTSINNNTNSTTDINTGTSNALVTIGGGSGTFSLQTTNIDISAAGAITGATGITSASGNITASAGNLVATAGDLVFGSTTRITNAGIGTFISGTAIGSQTFTTNNISDSGALTINATSAALTLQTTTSGNVVLNSAGGSIELQDDTNITGEMTVLSTTSPQLTVGYDGSNKLTIDVSSIGVATLTALGSDPSIVLDNGTGSQLALLGNGDITLQSESLVSLGDYQGSGNGTALYINDTTEKLTFERAGNPYFLVDSFNGLYKLGDISNILNSWQLNLDASNKTGFLGNTDGTKITLNENGGLDSTLLLRATESGDPQGVDLLLDRNTSTIMLSGGSNYGTTFTLDDNNGKFTFENGNVGIGIAIPNAPLEVKGQDGPGNIRLTNYATDDTYNILSVVGEGALVTESYSNGLAVASSFVIHGDGGASMYLSQSGTPSSLDTHGINFQYNGPDPGSANSSGSIYLTYQSISPITTDLDFQLKKSGSNIIPLKLQGSNGFVGIGNEVLPSAQLDIDLPDSTSITSEQIGFRLRSTSQTVSSGTTIANWRAGQFLAPTINGIAGGSTETITNAATLYIDAAPSGSDITITNPYALWVDDGNVRFDGDLYVNGDDLFMTTNTTGFILVADGTNYNPVDVSGDIDIASNGATTIQANSVALSTDTTGNYVLSVTNGNGIAGGDGGSEGAALTLALGPLTANWNQTGAFDISLNNSSSELQILESTGNTYFGSLDVGDLSANRTYTLPDADGTICISGGTCAASSVAWSAITNPTGTQSLTFDDGELNSWAVSSDTETFHTITANLLSSGTILSLASNGTAAAASQTGLNISLQGTNATSGITTYGAQISNTHAGTTSTNVALQLTASGGTTANYALLTNGGNVGIGDTTPSALFTVGSGDLFQVASNGNLTTSNAGTWTFSNDTDIVLTGGTNGLSIDGTTFSVDGANNRIGIGTAGPTGSLEVYTGGAIPADGLLHLYNNGGNTSLGASILEIDNTGNTVSPIHVKLSSTDVFVVGPSGFVNDNNGFNFQGNISGSTQTGNSSRQYVSRVASDSLYTGGLPSYGLLVEPTGNNNTTGNLQAAIGAYITGATGSGGGYGIVADSSSVGTLNVGGYFSASGSTNNYAIITGGGNVGIGTTAPDKALEINSAAGNNLRLTYNDSNGSATNYADLLTTSGGNLEVRPSGGTASIIASSGVETIAGSTPFLILQNSAGDAHETFELIEFKALDADSAVDGIGRLGFQNHYTGSTYVGNFVVATGRKSDTSYTERFRVDGTNGFAGIGTSSSDARLELAGNVSHAAWGLNGIQLQGTAATYTDTGGAGTRTNAVANSFGIPTFDSSNAVTITDAANVYIAGAPADGGANMTLTKAYALWVDDGKSRFDGQVGIGNLTGYTGYLTVRSSTSADYVLSLEQNSNNQFWKAWIEDGSFGGTNGSIYWDTQGTSDSMGGALAFGQNGRLGIGLGYATIDAKLHIAGNTSQAAWGLNGIQLRAASATYTDSNTAASGTATNAVFNSFAVPTLAATNSSVTTTNAATLYVAGAPTAGTNQTITNAYALWVDAGTARFDGDVVISGTCTGCGGGATAWDAIADPSGNGAINMGTTVQTLDWGATTTTDNLTVTSSATGLTSGSAFKVTSATTGAVTNGIVQLLASGAYTGTGGLLNVTGNSIQSANLATLSSTAQTTGTGLSITGGGANLAAGGELIDLVMGAATAGNGINIATTGVYTGTGLAVLTANSATTGIGQAISMTGQTSGTGLSITGGGANLLAAGELVDLNMGAATVGAALNMTTTGAYTGDGVLQLTADSATTGDLVKISGAALTTGSSLVITGPSGATAGVTDAQIKLTSNLGNTGTTNGLLHSNATITTTGAANTGVNGYFRTTNSPTSNSNFAYSLYSNITDSTALANSIYGFSSSASSSGNAAKTIYGTVSSASSTSTTADTLYGGNYAAIQSGVMTSGTSNTYGLYASASLAGNNGATQNVYGLFTSVDNAQTSGTQNVYGVYVDNSTSTTNGTTLKYGVYVEPQTGADNNYGAYFGSSVGILTATPENTLQIGALGSTATATPDTLSLGGTYGNAAGTIPKLKIWEGGGFFSGFGTDADSLEYMVFGGGTHSWYIGGASSMTLDASSNLSISSLSGNGTRCLQTDNSGVISEAAAACGTGSLTVGTTAINSGTAGRILFEGSGNVLQEAAGLTWNETDSSLVLTTSSTTSANKALNVSQTGATSGTDYAGYFSNTGAATTNVGVYAIASGATNNYAAIFEGGSVGIGTASPQTTLEVRSASQNLSYGAAIGTTRAGMHLAPISSNADYSNAITFGANGAGSLENANAGIYVQSSNSYGTRMYLATTDDFGAGSKPRIAILENGNVGIGDTTPAALFTVGSSDLFQIASNGNLTSSNAGTWTFSNDTNFVLTGGTNGISFDTDTLSIDASNDRIGIGTSGPDRRLDVLDASNPQLRLTTTDGSVYGEFQNTANSNAILTGSTLAGSVKQYGLQVTPTINQSSAAGASYTGLDVNVTETGTSSLNGLNRLADLRVGSSSKLAISNTGSLLLQNAANVVTPYGSLGTFSNHLVRSEDLTTTWTTSNISAITANGQTAPDGSTTAERLATSSSGGYVQQASSTAISAVDYTFSVWVRSSSGTQSFDLEIDGTTGGTAVVQSHTATTSWQRFSVTGTVSGGTGNVQVRIYPGGTAGTGTVDAWGAQLEKSSTANSYAYTTSGALTNTNRGETTVSNFATTSGFTYGGRHVINLEGAISASSTLVGQLIRVNDNATGTDDTATVRALEVQGYSGTNINGINTAIAGFGYTFGLHAETTAQASDGAQPAAVFADLNNGSAPTIGNAIRAFSDNVTSSDLVSFIQTSTTFSGNGLEMNFGFNGSGNFTGNYISLQENSTQYAHIDAEGNAFFSLRNTGTEAVCHVGNDAVNDDELTSCSGSPAADYAEMYPVIAGSSAGDVMVSGTEMVNTYDVGTNGLVNWNDVKGKITRLVKSNGGYQSNIIGIVSDNYGDFSSTGYNIKEEDNPKSVALVGRVPVKVTAENGTINPGDYLTTSATTPGKAMKATRPGMVIGQALSSYNGTGIAEVMIFVNPFYYDPTMVVDSSGNVNLQMGTAGTTLVAQTEETAAYTIDQQGSGALLQLQQNGMDRLLVQNNGSLNLNVTPADDIDLVLEVKAADTSVFTINARGDLAVQGVILVKDDSFAGSIATLEDGSAEITFTYDLGTGKPVVQLTAESDQPVFAQIMEFKKDEEDRYTGFIIKTFGFGGSPVSAVVHYNVTAKQDGYVTYGETVGVQEQPDNSPIIIDNGQVVSGDFTPINPDEVTGVVAGEETIEESTDTPTPATPEQTSQPDESSQESSQTSADSGSTTL